MLSNTAENIEADTTARLLLPASTAMQRKSRSNQLEPDPLSDAEDPEAQASSASFQLAGRGVLVSLTGSSLSIKDANVGKRCCISTKRQFHRVLYSDVITATSEEQMPSWWHKATWKHSRQHVLLIHTFRRERHKRCHWHSHTLRLISEDAEVVQRYAGSIASAARQTGQRPEALLIFINPFGGARRARQTWETVVQPLFRLAGDPVQA